MRKVIPFIPSHSDFAEPVSQYANALYATPTNDFSPTFPILAQGESKLLCYTLVACFGSHNILHILSLTDSTFDWLCNMA